MNKNRNTGLIVYKFYRRFNREVPTWLAHSLAKRFRQDFENMGIDLFWLRTYDGSSQFVHPHIVKWKEEFWLVATPYPYGMSSYENPCIYCGESIENLREYSKNPLDMPKPSSSGMHFSDPCLYQNNDSLYCFYRETRKINQDSEINVLRDTILCRKMEDNLCWGPPRVILSEEREVDGLLSPALLRSIDGSLHMAHVRLKGNKSQLIFNSLSEDLQPQNEVTGQCHGLPDNYFIWHIDIITDYPSSTMKNKLPQYRGLFLLQHVANPSKYQLYFARSNANCHREWYIEKKVVLPEKLRPQISYLYKSCFVPNSRHLLVGFRDKNSRFGAFLAEWKPCLRNLTRF